jgi:hypothetical protein
MLTHVDMTAIAVPRTFTIGGVNPDDTIILKSISGLSPSDVTLFTGDFAGNGGYYQGRRVPGRNPVFTFKLNPSFSTTGGRSVSSLRRELYAMFYEPTYNDNGLQVDIFDDEIGKVSMKVYADKTQNDMFSQDTSVQISTQCMEAFLMGPQVSATPNAISVPITYAGSAPAGFDSLQIKAASAGTQFSVQIANKTMTWVGAIAANDIFTIGTEEGNLFIKKNGVDALGGLSAASQWVTLAPGANTLATWGNASGDGKTSITSYAYTPKYWGL